MNELERGKCRCIKRLKRQTNMFANTALMAVMHGRFITLKIQTLENLMQSSGARMPKAVVP
jgi:hypothetical protein